MLITSGVILAAAFTIYFFMKGKLFGTNEESIEVEYELCFVLELCLGR